MKRKFLLIAHDAPTDGLFSLDDLPGSAGRIDVVARCITSALLRSYGIRRDTEVLILFCQPPFPGLTIRVSGEKVKYLNPDERSTAALLRNALLKARENETVESSPGFYVFPSSLETLLASEKNVYYLKEEGRAAEEFTFPGEDLIFVLGDHKDLTPDEEAIVLRYAKAKLNISPLSLHSEHCITIIHNILDRWLVKNSSATGGQSRSP